MKRWLLVSIILHLLYSGVQGCMPSGGAGLRTRSHRNEPPLVFKQYVPNVPELSPQASGPLEGLIPEGSVRQQDLIVNNNRDIVFKDEEGNSEDRTMTVRCHEKLDLLAMLVKSAWKKRIKLMVTEAWDTRGRHNYDSLHYEGRAIDIMASDRDSDKLGMLASLAVQAGFDWVYYESRKKVHVSCKSDIYHGRHSALKCFSGDSLVQLESGLVKNISQLSTGDKVLSIDSATGHPIYSPILLFLHKQPTYEPTEFMQIFISNDSMPLSVTPFHLLHYCSEIKYAHLVKKGDCMKTLRGVNSAVEFTPVVKVRRVVRSQSYYSPLTKEGNLIVNGIVASCYANVHSPQLAHAVMWPVRLLYSCMSVNILRHDYGIHWYSQFLLHISRILENCFSFRVLI